MIRRKLPQARILMPAIVLSGLLLMGVTVRKAIRCPKAIEDHTAPTALLFSKCMGLASQDDPAPVRAAVLFAHHNDRRFSLPMAVELAAIASRTSDSTAFVVVTPEPGTLISNIPDGMGKVAVVGKDWLDFAPHMGTKLILPALVLTREPGQTAFQWVGSLDTETLSGVLKAFCSGMDPELTVPGEGDVIPAPLKEALAAKETTGPADVPRMLALIFLDPSCDVCLPAVEVISELAAGLDVRTVIVASGPLNPQDLADLTGSFSEIIADDEMQLFSAMRITIVPTLVLADTDGSIVARVDGLREKKILEGVMARFRAAAARASAGTVPLPPAPPLTASDRGDRKVSGPRCYFFVSHECDSCQRLLEELASRPLAARLLAYTSAMVVFEDTALGDAEGPQVVIPNARVACDREHDILASFGVVNMPAVVCLEEDGSEIMRWSPDIGAGGNPGDAVEALLDGLERRFLMENGAPNE